MHIDTPTLISYTAVLIALVGGLFVFFWSREERPATLFWLSLPFFMGAAGAALLVSPTLKLGDWALRLGVFFILLAYGFGWQAVRRICGRPPSPLLVVAPTVVWLILSMMVLTKSGDWLVINASIRRGLVALFTGLSAYELWRSREAEDLRSRRVLFWVFATFCALNLVRIPFVSILPAPLGAAPTQTWSVVVYNLEAVTLVLLVSVFLIVLSRERMSSRNYGLALRDAMTNVYNRRAYHEHMQALNTNGEGPMPPYALLVLDIDRFKSINDRFGHQLGDKVIVLAAQTAEATLRKHDRVFRLGGEEFACLLPDTGLPEACDAAERVRLAFQKTAAAIDGTSIGATISIGVAATECNATADQVFAQADAALYEAKRSGRNRTVVASGDESRERRGISIA